MNMREDASKRGQFKNIFYYKYSCCLLMSIVVCIASFIFTVDLATCYAGAEIGFLMQLWYIQSAYITVWSVSQSEVWKPEVCSKIVPQVPFKSSEFQAIPRKYSKTACGMSCNQSDSLVLFAS